MSSWINATNALQSFINIFGSGTSGQFISSNGGTSPFWKTILAIANGGTGVSSVTTTPAASSFAGWNANALLSGDGSFLGGVYQTGVNTTFTKDTSGNPMPEYCAVFASSAITITLPVYNGGIDQGRSCTIFNINGSTCVVTVVEPGGTICVVYPGQCVKVVCRNVSVGSYIDAWGVFGMSQISPDPSGGFGGHFITSGVSGTLTWTVSGTPRILDSSHPTNICLTINAASFVVVNGQINMPLKATLPEGITYYFTCVNIGAGTGFIQIRDGGGATVIGNVGNGVAASMTVTLQDSNWVSSYGSTAYVTAS